MQIEWKPVDDDLKKAIVRFVDERSGADAEFSKMKLSVQKAWLSFYPQLGFVQLTDETEPEAKKQLYALLDPDADEVTVLDMTNEPVYALNNSGQLRLRDEEDVRRYVSFFFSCVAGPFGLMPVIEKIDLPPEETLDPETRAALADIREITPPRAEKEGTDWRVRAALLFQGSVFKTEIVVDPAGVVRVDKYDLALASGAPENTNGGDGDGALDD